MVQFFKGSVDPRDAAFGSLAQALGEGIGTGVQSYMANKAIENVMNDKTLENASPAERMSAIEKALRPYGEKGQKLLQNRMVIEQQREQEVQQKKMNKKAPVLAKRLNDEPLTEEEKKIEFTPEEEMAIAKHKQTAQIATIKAANKNPLGGLTGQPIPPDVNQTIKDVLAKSQGMNADQLKQSMDQAGVPPTYSNPYIENRRQETKPVFEPTSDKIEAERVGKLADEIEKDYMAATNENMRLDRQLELSRKGNLSTPMMVKTMDFLGLPLGILGNQDTEEYAKLEADYVRDVSNVFPGQIRVFEIQAYLKTIPSLLNSQAGQEAIIHNRKLLNEAKMVRYNAYKDILKENNGKRPPNMGILLQEKIAPQMADIADRFKAGIDAAIEKDSQKIRMYDNQGKAYDIPMNRIPDAQTSGLKFGK